MLQSGSVHSLCCHHDKVIYEEHFASQTLHEQDADGSVR